MTELKRSVLTEFQCDSKKKGLVETDQLTGKITHIPPVTPEGRIGISNSFSNFFLHCFSFYSHQRPMGNVYEIYVVSF